MTQFLLRIKGNESKQPLSLQGKKRWLLGRHPSCDVHIPDPRASREHCLLTLKEGKNLFVEDMSPKNPTLLNNLPLKGATEIQVGDVLLVGETHILIESAPKLRVRIVKDSEDLDSQETLVLDETPPDEKDETLLLVNHLADALLPVQSQEDASLMTLELIEKWLPCNQGVITKINSKNQLQVLATLSSKDPEATIRISRSLIQNLRKIKKPFCILDTSKERGMSKVFKKNGGKPSGFFVAPLMTREGLSGLIYLERDNQQVCSNRDLEMASSLARILASRLETIELLDRLHQENVELRLQKSTIPPFLGRSEAWKRLIQLAEKLVFHTHPILLLGETGTGKTALARHIHFLKNRKNSSPLPSPFVVLDAEADPTTNAKNPESRIKEELLGSNKRGILKAGKLCAAHRGTLFIRSIHLLPKKIQKDLMERLETSFLESSEGKSALKVRLMASSNRTQKELRSGNELIPELKQALLLNPLEIPPLRERREDTPLLTSHFLQEFSKNSNREPPVLSPRALERICSYHWPRNVSELREVLTTAAVLSKGHQIYPKHLPSPLGGKLDPSESPPAIAQSLEEVERNHILRVLSSVGGNKLRTAEILGIAYSTLFAKLKKYQKEAHRKG